ncbi:hypothetical protein BST81_00620 [Leptolyngbya sp. 'hensonii']|nr:hypothetical protein BST81_00620 [Leptolyngbya sp. 'hensonii']
MLVLMGSLCLFLVVLFQRTPTVAQSGIQSAVVAEIVDGSQVFIQNQQARVNDVAGLGQRVRTGQARTQLVFNTGAVARLAPNSSLTVGQKCARLQRGTLLINGVANGCTNSVATGVRGTTYLLEVDENDQTQVKVLEGEVTISKPDPLAAPEVPIVPPTPSLAPTPAPTPSKSPAPTKSVRTKSTPKPTVKPASSPTPNPSPLPAPPSPAPPQLPGGEQRSLDQPIVLSSGQKALIPPGANPVIGQMTQQEFEQILKGVLFNGYSVQIPGLSEVKNSFSQLFPGIPFPIDIPGLSVPGIPGIPGIPFF